MHRLHRRRWGRTLARPARLGLPRLPPCCPRLAAARLPHARPSARSRSRAGILHPELGKLTWAMGAARSLLSARCKSLLFVFFPSALQGLTLTSRPFPPEPAAAVSKGFALSDVFRRELVRIAFSIAACPVRDRLAVRCRSGLRGRQPASRTLCRSPTAHCSSIPRRRASRSLVARAQPPSRTRSSRTPRRALGGRAPRSCAACSSGRSSGAAERSQSICDLNVQSGS